MRDAVERAWWNWWCFAWQSVGFQAWKDSESCVRCRRLLCVCPRPERTVRS
jgi:hypothetical protein